jgi:HSP20 family molecular chaperone IbpA
MTTRQVVFDSPFLLGFEQTRSLIERVAKAAAETYPPYNVEQLPDGGVRITLAVAGFSADQLAVTVEGQQLVITGRREDAAGKDSQAWLHRGIAARNFMRSFVLAEGMEVSGAVIEHGLLHIELSRPEPAEKVKRIPIRTA